MRSGRWERPTSGPRAGGAHATVRLRSGFRSERYNQQIADGHLHSSGRRDVLRNSTSLVEPNVVADRPKIRWKPGSSVVAFDCSRSGPGTYRRTLDVNGRSSAAGGRTARRDRHRAAGDKSGRRSKRGTSRATRWPDGHCGCDRACGNSGGGRRRKCERAGIRVRDACCELRIGLAERGGIAGPPRASLAGGREGEKWTSSRTQQPNAVRCRPCGREDSALRA